MYELTEVQRNPTLIWGSNIEIRLLRITSYCFGVSSSSCTTTVNVWCHIVNFLTVLISHNGPFSCPCISPKYHTILYKQVYEISNVYLQQSSVKNLKENVKNTGAHTSSHVTCSVLKYIERQRANKKHQRVVTSSRVEKATTLHTFMFPPNIFTIIKATQSYQVLISSIAPIPQSVLTQLQSKKTLFVEY